VAVQLVSVLDVKAATRVRVDELCRKHGIAIPKVTFNLTGTYAGVAYIERNWMDFNMMLFRENFEESIEETVAHELAHLWHTALKIGGRAHGKEWKALMRRMEVAPRACHNMNTDAAASTTGFFLYRCLCNTGNMVSFEKHRRMQEYPEDYFCGRCEQQFVYVG
jgi:SprT protein